MKHITSSEYAELERRLQDSIDIARERVCDDEMLAIAIHPKVDTYFKESAGIDDDAELRGIGGVRNTVLTESVPGYRIIICNENL